MTLTDEQTDRLAASMDHLQIVIDIERIALGVWDVRDESNRLRDLADHEKKFLDDMRAVRDRHNNYIGSAQRQYGNDSEQMRLIRQISDRQKAREMMVALKAYQAACGDAE